MVGNPANTNCLIAMKNAPSLKPAQFTAMMRLDHNRATSQVAQKVGKPVVPSIKKMTVWGNHSATQYPDLFQAEADGKKVWPMINDQAWLEIDLHPHRAEARRRHHRGARPVLGGQRGQRRHRPRARLGPSAPATGDWVTMGIPSDGSYGIPEGVLYGYPVTCKGGKYEIVKGIEISDFSRKRMDATLKELHEERDGVKHLLG